MENIIGKNIYLRPLTLEDTDLLVNWRNKERVLSNFFRQVKITKEGHESWFHKMIDTGEVIEFVICQKENDCPVGCVYLQNIEWEYNKAEEGVFLGEESALGKGYAKEAAAAVRDWAFANTDYDCLYSYMTASNVASYATAESIGMEKLKEYTDEADGLLYVYAITRKQWDQMK